MVKEEQKNATLEAAEDIESRYRVDHVESGLPRWLIEAAFGCTVVEAAFNWGPSWT